MGLRPAQHRMWAVARSHRQHGLHLHAPDKNEPAQKSAGNGNGDKQERDDRQRNGKRRYNEIHQPHSYHPYIDDKEHKWRQGVKDRLRWRA